LPLGGCHERYIGKAANSGAQCIQARAMDGGYSLITQQPLRGKWGNGQDVSVAHIRWLQSRGFVACIAELTSLKSDDVVGRTALAALVDEGKLHPEAVPEPGPPETLLIMRNELMTLGLAVTFEDAGSAVAAKLRPATTEDIISMSSGPVTRPETLNYRTLLDIEGGLFCPKVFGRSEQPRRMCFGHFALSWPVISPLWRLGKPSLLERLLDRSAAEIAAIFAHELWVMQVNGQWELRPFGSARPNQSQDVPSEGHLTGAAAIEAMLRDVPTERVPPGLRGRPESLALRAAPVMPPDHRPLVLLDNGNFATSDLNDLYRRLINRGNRLAKLEELKAPPVILWNERRELQRAADTLWANRRLPEHDQVVGTANRPLVDALYLLERRLLDEDGKRVEWSGRARAVASQDLAGRIVLVPRSIFTILHLDSEQPILATSDQANGRFIALLPRPHDHAVVVMPPDAFATLGLDTIVDSQCVLHRPLGVQACAEARRLLDGDPGAHAEVPDDPSWPCATDSDTFVARLVDAAVNETRVLLDGPRGIMAAGPGRVVFAADTELPIRGYPSLEVPRPPEMAPLTGKVLLARIREAIHESRRRACVFHLTPTDEVAVGEGHVGGLPDLPPGVEWPRSRSGYLPFLAQLPLDAARGLLPIEAPPGSMLAIFEPPLEDEGLAAPGAAFLVPPGPVERRSAPDGVRTYRLCKIEAELVEELPCWEEAVQVLQAELGPIDQKALGKFHSSEWKVLPAPAAKVKLGGWPAWIQAPEADTALLAQIVSCDEAEMSFVDAGTIYVFATGNARFEVMMQYY
jgi:hypothetical protein